MLSKLRTLQSIVLWQNTDEESITRELEGAAVPVATDPCRSCAEPCEEGKQGLLLVFLDWRL